MYKYLFSLLFRLFILSNAIFRFFPPVMVQTAGQGMDGSDPHR